MIIWRSRRWRESRQWIWIRSWPRRVEEYNKEDDAIWPEGVWKNRVGDDGLHDKAVDEDDGEEGNEDVNWNGKCLSIFLT